MFVKKLNNNSVSFSNQQEYHTFLLKDMIIDSKTEMTKKIHNSQQNPKILTNST